MRRGTTKAQKQRSKSPIRRGRKARPAAPKNRRRSRAPRKKNSPRKRPSLGPSRAAARRRAPVSAASLPQTVRASASAPAPKPFRDAPPAAAQALKLKIPPILLEGDDLAKPASVPGKSAFPTTEAEAAAAGSPVSQTAPATVVPSSVSEKEALPAAQPEENRPLTTPVFVEARDAQWLHVHWDMAPVDQRACARRSADGRLRLRIHRGPACGQPSQEIAFEPEARDRFVRVDEAGAAFVAELGYVDSRRNWVSMGVSAAGRTPFESMAAEPVGEIRTVALEPPKADAPPAIAGDLAAAPLSPSDSGPMPVPGIGAEPLPAFPVPAGPAPEIEGFPVSFWTPEQEQAMAEVLAWSLQEPGVDAPAAFPGAPQSLPPASAIARAALDALIKSSFQGPSVSSPGAPPARPGGPGQFRFSVNAELLIYGATEPDARVTVGGRPVALGPDGSFSVRVALPDGAHWLRAEAVNAAGSESRAADLIFSRSTVCHGEVQAHPQAPGLEPPSP